MRGGQEGTVVSMQPLPAISMLSDGMEGRQGEARRPGGFLKGLIDVNV